MVRLGARTISRVLIQVVGYDHPDAARLAGEVQQEYVVRYGGPDETPVDPAQFAPPQGLFVVGYVDGRPAACGGWRARERSADGLADGDAELKRMYVVESLRGRGLARRLLAELERNAADAGRVRMVLETGTRQPEAVGLYSSAGYQPIPKFGQYRRDPLSLCFAKVLPAPGSAWNGLRRPVADVRLRPS